MKPRSAGLASGRPGAAGVAAAFCLALFLPALTGSARAQCNQGAVTCANNAAMRTCMATLMCSDPATQVWVVGVTMNLNVTMCSPFLIPQSVTGMTVTIPLTAMALRTAPTARYCDWYWYRKPFPPSPPNFGFATISTTHGLPVELMEFSVEAGDESTDGEGREAAAQ